MSNEPASSVIEANDENFEQAVLQKSFEVPVLVDFWAPWCAPCREIGPILEKLADEGKGRFILAKVNMDENPNLAYALQIRSIPAVKLLVDGTLKDEFLGTIPEPEVREFLDRNLPTEQDREAKAGLDILQAGDSTAAEAVFRETLEQDSANAKARVGLGRILVDSGKWAEAKTLIENLDEDDEIRRDLVNLRAGILLYENAGVEQELLEALQRNPKDLAAQFALYCRYAIERKFQEAMEGFLEIVKSDRKFMDDAGRRGMIAVLDILPEGSELDSTYRNKLSSILFR